MACSKNPASLDLSYDKPRCMHVEGRSHLCPDKRTVNVPIKLLNTNASILHEQRLRKTKT